jgi:dihydrofolate reductase
MDFIPDSYWPLTLAVLERYDCIVLGRKTFETIQHYEKELRDSFDVLPVRKVVITTDKEFHPNQGYEVAHTPEAVIQSNLNIVVTSGPTLNQYLLDKNLVDRITYHQVPDVIGEGIKPYHDVGTVEVVKLELAERIG